MTKPEFKILRTNVKLTQEEREVHINIYLDTDGEWVAELETCLQKYDTRCRKQGWYQVSETRHHDGSWISSVWKAPAKALTVREANPKPRIMSEEQRQAASERFAKLWQERQSSD